MREVDRRSKHTRRVFLKGAATTVPAVAVATSTGLAIADAWADDATTLTPATLKTLVKVARDIYPHDMLTDSYYIPWLDRCDVIAVGQHIVRIDVARDLHQRLQRGRRQRRRVVGPGVGDGEPRRGRDRDGGHRRCRALEKDAAGMFASTIDFSHGFPPLNVSCLRLF